ncbi:4-hydroxybenzoate 3-monooxygenase [Yinghuangia aomiensis]|uniref:4-hydroxybenzoate 3-monooxygenase n=1 Tax=Yinghuangia aomiensis TaxID=676205 RepID=A0ABP9HY58_9ACTN
MTGFPVVVVGAGPAGLVLANVLHRAGVPVEVLERRSRAEVETQARAGLVEHRVVEYLREHGLADGLLAAAGRHDWCEFRVLGERFRVPYGELSGGAGHRVYPQQFLVRDLIASLEAVGGAVRFGTPALAVETAGERLRVHGADRVREAEYVVGCDGPDSLVARAFPAGSVVERRYPYDWLTVLAEVDRPVDGVRYALHEAGFAGMMPRTPRLARCYLQVPADADSAAWPETRITEQLLVRLGVAAEDPRLGAVVESSMLRLRGRVRERLCADRLFLAGDAARVLTPAGPKGMNSAVADVADLADCLVRRYRDGDADGLAGYERRRREASWAAQEFSDRLLDLLHLPPDAATAFTLRLRRQRIARLAAPGPEAEAFARVYAGAGRLDGGPAARVPGQSDAAGSTQEPLAGEPA